MTGGGGKTKAKTTNGQGKGNPWHTNGARVQAFSEVAQTASMMLAPVEYDSAELQFEDFGEAALTGIGQGASLGFAIQGAALGPVGIIAAGGFMVLSLLSASKKRAAAENKWKRAVKDYKSKIQQQYRGIKSTAKAYEKRAKSGDLNEIFKATTEAANKVYSQLDVQATDIKNVTQEERAESIIKMADSTVESVYDKLLNKVDILNEASDLLQRERTASRSFGQLKTGWYDKFEEKLGELDNV